MKRFCELMSRLSAQTGVVAMLLGLMLAGSSQVLAAVPVSQCTPACTAGLPGDAPPCSTQGGTCVPKAGAPAGAICGCSYATLKNAQNQVIACTAVCGGLVVNPPKED